MPSVIAASGRIWSVSVQSFAAVRKRSLDPLSATGVLPRTQCLAWKQGLPILTDTELVRTKASACAHEDGAVRTKISGGAHEESAGKQGCAHEDHEDGGCVRVAFVRTDLTGKNG